MSLAASPFDPNVLWAGSDDGLVYLTQDGGKTWKNVSPKKMQEGIVNSIEVSPHNPAKAYVVLMRYKSMDLTPYIFKTEDFGKSWNLITDGIEGDHTFVRVVRADKKVPGLLYAGTETGLYISHDDGAHWKTFQNNLPVVPVNDLFIQDNDLIAATAGRSFWILDDLSNIQEQQQVKGLHLVTPKTAYRLSSGKTPKGSLQGTNPVSGMNIDYHLAVSSDSLEVTLEILDKGEVIRRYTSKKPEKKNSWPGGPGSELILPKKEGFNRMHWDFRRAPVPAVNKVFVYGSYEGSRVGPGNYTARLTYGEEQQETTLTVLPNPKIEASQADFDEQQKLLVEIDNTLGDIHNAVTRMRNIQMQLQHYGEVLKGKKEFLAVIDKAKTIEKKLKAWEVKLIQPKQKTFQDVINFNNKLNAEWMYLKGFVDSDDPKVTQGAKDRFQDLMEQWKTNENELNAIIEVDFEAFESLYRSVEVPALVIQETK